MLLDILFAGLFLVAPGLDLTLAASKTPQFWRNDSDNFPLPASNFHPSFNMAAFSLVADNPSDNGLYIKSIDDDLIGDIAGVQQIFKEGFLRDGEEISFPLKLTTASNISINLYGLIADVNLELHHIDGTSIVGSAHAGRGPEAIATSLPPGLYLLTLSANGRRGTPYQLSAITLASQPFNSPTLVEHVIPPLATDQSITDPPWPHYATLDPAVPSRGQLLVFLPGTNGQPLQTRLIVQKAAALGYHAINLAYPNSIAVSSAAGCRFSQNQNCAENLRLEILDGLDRSPRVAISPSNSVDNRLRQILHYLAQQYPDQGWSTYLDGDTLDWSKVVVAGHSQGGGHAALIAKHKPVSRVVLFAPGLDYSPVFKDFPPWVAQESVTPAERYYAFQHVRDQIFGFQRQLQGFQLLGIDAFGPPVSVDQSLPPYATTHQLMTALPPALPGVQEHSSVVVDICTPRWPDGSPIYSDAWGYLLGEARD